VTLLARLRGWSMSHSRNTAIWYASSCNGITVRIGYRKSSVSGIVIT